MVLDTVSNLCFAFKLALNTDLHRFHEGRSDLTVRDEWQWEGGKVGVGEDSPLEHAEISTSAL